MLRSLLIVLTFLIAAPAFAQNSCEYANDNECDESRFGGQGYCADGTDSADCSLLNQGIANNDCTFANDGECDEFRFGGTGSCQDGSDTNDCNLWQVQRESDFFARANALGLSPDTINGLGNNTCRWNNDGECDDIFFGGSGACDPGTDASDCLSTVNTDAAAPMDTDNSCPFANDGECDETQYGGGGFCDAGTDTNDCSANIAAGPIVEDNSCLYANDNECDEARFGGGGYCEAGTDSNDCTGLAQAGGSLEDLLALVPQTLRARLGDDSCQYSNDGECDDVSFGGTPYCTPGTDASDCRAMALGGEDSCQWANDNECDEPGIGTDNCTSGTDMTDCADVAYLRNRTDTCITAFDGICNEPSLGNGTCEAFSDTADCLGRSRPAGLENHFFGRDDRVLVDATQLPWRAIGSLELQDGNCTGTLVGPTLVLTAAHCVTDTGAETNLPISFTAGLSRGNDQGRANVIAAVFDPSYTDDTQPAGGGNGHDWALVVLDRTLGDDVGYLDVHELTATELSQIGRAGLIVNQAGYSWDTGDNMSGNVGCRIIQAYDDNSILHECDTAQGDSGSPFLLNIDGEWHIVAVDSTFFDPDDDKTPFGQANLAVDSRAFAASVRQQR